MDFSNTLLKDFYLTFQSQRDIGTSEVTLREFFEDTEPVL
jgi:hypothetical protein